LTTQDTLLDGRVRISQGSTGHRCGIEPVLLAAFVPAKPGQRVIEAGTGSGAALLCLAARVEKIDGLGVEIEPGMAGLARDNFVANGCDRLAVLEGDLAEASLPGMFDHAMANPPWHVPSGTKSPDDARALARHARPGLMALWARRLASSLRHRGTLSFITGAGTLSECLAGFSEAGCGSHTIFPLWPREGRDCKLVLLQGVRGGHGPTRVLSGLVLHVPDGGYTEAANAVLRGLCALPQT
jgi:tRNA1(Val) A37 N6-methylase TrmN6